MTKVQVPQLIVADNSPFNMVELKCLQKQNQIEKWFRDKWRKPFMPFSCSVDMRNSGFKVSSVDANLFPAGFNLLNPDFLPLCVQAMQYVISSQHPKCQRILIIPEAFSRNIHYFESVYRLAEIVRLAGYELMVGQLDMGLDTKYVTTKFGDLEIHPITRKEDRLYVDDFNPCVILLNRDLSEGIPSELINLSQTVVPSVKLGWSTRKKSNHFTYYNQICEEFATILDIDPWLISPINRHCGDLDFMHKEGTECLAEKVNDLLGEIKKLYKTYQVEHEPFVAIKADSGTYGMAVTMVKDANEILAMNRKTRIKMSKSKGGQEVHQVMIQEGVYSFETLDGAVTEPVIYLIGNSVVGGFYRVHRKKGISDNLNSPGMEFKTLPFSQACNVPNYHTLEDDAPNRFYVYGIIARLALLATMQEIEGVSNETA